MCVFDVHQLSRVFAKFAAIILGPVIDNKFSILSLHYYILFLLSNIGFWYNNIVRSKREIVPLLFCHTRYNEFLTNLTLNIS